MDNSDACIELAKTIQSGDDYPEAYGYMLQVYMTMKENGETCRMALAEARYTLTYAHKKGLDNA